MLGALKKHGHPLGTVGGSLCQRCVQCCLYPAGGAGAEAGPSECRAGLALLPSCWLHFCLKYNPGFGGAAWGCVTYPCGRPQLGQSPFRVSRGLSWGCGAHTSWQTARAVGFFPLLCPPSQVGWSLPHGKTQRSILQPLLWHIQAAGIHRQVYKLGLLTPASSVPAISESGGPLVCFLQRMKF